MISGNAIGGRSVTVSETVYEDYKNVIVQASSVKVEATPMPACDSQYE
jgi:hypothetical protein